MHVTVGSASWGEIDQWWDARTIGATPVQANEADRLLEPGKLVPRLTELDPWWTVFERSAPAVETDETYRVLLQDQYAGELPELDPWWDSYVSFRREQAEELRERLGAQDGIWESSPSRFDADPLASDWTDDSETAGPIRPRQEENWSQWLSHLIRTSPSGFLEKWLPGTPETRGRAVEREVWLREPAEDRLNRRADILVGMGGGISIEVKIGDENYTKTTHTAELVERHYRGKWTHVLLLPQRKLPALKQSFPQQGLGENSPQAITTGESDPITVVLWEDLARALRETVREADSESAHWDASAYSFCTLIEQKILDFTPEPVVDRSSASEGVVRMDEISSLSGESIEEQMSYLDETTRGNDG